MDSLPMTPLEPADRQRLISFIEEHAPFDEAEAQHQISILDLLRTCATPLDRQNYFDIRFLCRVDPQPITPASDAEQGRWFSVAELRQLAIDPGMHRMKQKCLQRGILTAN